MTRERSLYSSPWFSYNLSYSCLFIILYSEFLVVDLSHKVSVFLIIIFFFFWAVCFKPRPHLGRDNH